MFRIVLALTVIAAAFGFAPSNVRSSSAVKMAVGDETMSKSIPFLKKPKNLEGLVGSEEFDPIGFAEYSDIKWMREAEIKHCRVAMLATVGWLVQSAGIHFPSPDGIYDKANPVDAFFSVGPSPLLQIFLTIGALESINHKGKLGMTDMHTDPNTEIGKFDLWFYGASQLKGKTQEQIDDLKLKELRNGRLAMFAIGGLVHQTLIAGTETFGAFPYTSIYGKVPGDSLTFGLF
jgi:hypothetical protein